MKATWYGHSNFKLEDGGLSVLIDPFFDGNPTAPVKWPDAGKVDIVLVTHDHADHVGQAVEICKATGAMLGAVVGTAEKLAGAGVPGTKIINGIGFNIGGTVFVNGAYISMVQAFHTSESGCPVGYIVRMPSGFTFYHSGDTGLFGDMALYADLHSLDLALLPIGGVFTMDSRQAAVAARLLRAKAVIPMHYGTFPALEQRADSFKAHLGKEAPGCKFVSPSPGGSVEL